MAFTGSETITYPNCADGTTDITAVNGSIELSSIRSAGSPTATYAVSFDLTTKSADATHTVTADLTTEVGVLADSVHADFAATVTSPTLTGKTSLSNVQFDQFGNESPTITESFDLESSQLGGRVHVDTAAPIRSNFGELVSGQLAITGATAGKLIITLLGQGQLELEDASPIYMSWTDVDAGAGVLTDVLADVNPAPGTTSP